MRRALAHKTAALFFALLLGALAAPAQSIITTVAGSNWVFTGNGGPAINAPLGPSWGVWVDSNGNVFASDGGNQQVVKISPSGTLTVIAGGRCCYFGDGGAATAAGLNGPRKVVTDTAGNVYFADGYNNRVRKVDTAGTISTIAGNGSYDYSGDGGPATLASLRLPFGIALDANGNLYIAEAENQRVRMVAPGGTITTVAGNGTAGFSGDGGPATGAQLNRPAGVVVDAGGNLYIADEFNLVVRKVAPGGTITTFAGGGLCCSAGDGGPATAAYMNHPYDLALDTAGNLYISEIYGNRVSKVSAGIITTVAGTGMFGYSGDGGPALDALLANPHGVAVSAPGDIYISEDRAYRVRKVTAGTISTIAGNGLFKYGGDGGPATAANLYFPNGVAVDAAGNIYIADTVNHRIRRVTAGGTISTLAGNGRCCLFIGDGGPATLAGLSYPNSVVLDAQGDVYFSDSGNGRVRKIDASGTISTFAGGGCCSGGGDGGPATAAALAPHGLAFDATGNLYIADTYFQRVRKVTPSGTITTVAGNGIAGFSGDGGLATAASLSYPSAVAADTAGNLYIADQYNNYRVRKVTPGGAITTVAGNGTYASSGDGGPATAASLVPNGLALDSNGSLYVSDVAYPYRIRKITPGGTITSVAGQFCCFYGDGGPASLAALNYPSQLAFDKSGRLYVADSGNDRIRAFTAGDGFLSARSTTAAISGTGRVPLYLTLNPGVSVDGVSFAVSATPNGGAPAISTALSFAAVVGLPAPSVADTGVASSIGLAFTGLATPLSGSVKLGDVLVSAGAGATLGQSYTVSVTGASASLGNNALTIAPGSSGTVTLARTFQVGDALPIPSSAGDLNGDGLFDSAGEFGDGTLGTVDLIQALRAVTNVPGYRPRGCSDLFDAMDSFPADTATSRGGDGALTNLDLIITLRRVTGVDSTRPARPSRLACTAGAGFQALARAGGDGGASLEFGAARPAPGAAGDSPRGRRSRAAARLRVPVYLRLPHDALLAGLSFAIGVEDGRGALRFEASSALAPSLVDSDVPGVLAVAYLSEGAGFRLSAGKRIPLGFVELPGGGNGAAKLRVYGLQADGTVTSEK